MSTGRADTEPNDDRPAPSGPGAVRADAAGSYLTDEVLLYRVVRCIGSGAAAIVELEDCYWLDVVCVHAMDLRARAFEW